MRVSPVSNYRKNNVSFGKFKDENAKEVVKQALATNDRVMKPTYDSWFGIIEKCDFFEAYTDKKDGIVKGRFTDEFIKENTYDTDIYSQRVINNNIQRLTVRGNLDDLSMRRNLSQIVNNLWNFKQVLKGKDLSKNCLSSNPYGDARIEEQRRQEKLDGLAD